MTDIAISVRNISKCYRVFDNQRSRLLHTIWPKYTKGMQEVWALKDINFEIKRGEAFAIIGRNGGGKTTLLEILTGTLTETNGTSKVNGRVSALLELGSGFNPEYSGRDNVILNGLLLGLNRTEILNRFDEIVDFAEIGAAIDRPVKTYSSGMMMRLAFAVQVLCEPDILIIDEALSVGDFFFQQKCFGHIRKLCEKGVTLLFVSHDMGTVRDLCARALYLTEGQQAYVGDAQEATRKYFANGSKDGPIPITVTELLAQTMDYNIYTALAVDALWLCAPDSTGRLLAIHIFDTSGRHLIQTEMSGTIVVRVSFRKLGASLPISITLMLKNKFDQLIFLTSSRQLNVDIIDAPCTDIAAFEFKLDLNIEAGLYSCKVACAAKSIGASVDTLDDSGWFGPLQVNWDYETKQPPFFGMFGLPVSGKISI
jgi:lipopolysaccharide transport system ATP-binding protein